MKQIVLILGLFTATYCFCQSNTQITYKWNTRYNEKILKGFPANVRTAIQQQIETIKYDATLNFDSNKSCYESDKQKKNATNKTVGDAASQNSNVRNSEVRATSKYSGDKFCIDLKKNTVTELKNGKTIIISLLNPNWKFTSKTKKILGHTCYEAVGKYNKSNITVYYTTEIKGQAIPLKMSFPAGVVLEYSLEFRHCVATAVSFNQPTIVDFFKNK
jgi:GLPGLI family protein